jgi:hypothetical protein
MSINDVLSKLEKTYLKLLKAEVKHKQNKVYKLEKKIIELELAMKERVYGK